MTDLKLYPWQQIAWQQFLSMRHKKRLPHAILISGAVGIGKQQFAERMVATLLCLNATPDGEACGHCHSCQLLIAGYHPDHNNVMPEEDGKQIKIDQIRDLKNKQSLTPHVAPNKTVIIKPADNMTTSAANSLLKLLEEPQQNTVLMLLTAKAEQLPITIRSRCQTLTIKTPERQSAISWLQEQKTQTDAEWELLLDLAAGAPPAALTLSTTDTTWLSEIEADFQQLLQGQGNPVEMASRWQSQDLLIVLQRLQAMVLQQVKQILSRSDTVSSSVNLHVYWQFADCILSTIKLISSQNNFNKTLLIEDFMVSIKQIATAHKSS